MKEGKEGILDLSNNTFDDEPIKKTERRNIAKPYQTCAVNYLTDEEIKAVEENLNAQKEKEAAGEDASDLEEKAFEILVDGHIRQIFSYMTDETFLIKDLEETGSRYIKTFCIIVEWKTTHKDTIKVLTKESLQTIIKSLLEFVIGDYAIKMLISATPVTNIYEKLQQQIEKYAAIFADKYIAIEGNEYYLDLTIEDYEAAFNVRAEANKEEKGTIAKTRPAESKKNLKALSLRHNHINQVYYNHTNIKNQLSKKNFFKNQLLPSLQQGQYALVPYSNNMMLKVMYDIKSEIIKDAEKAITQEHFFLLDIIYSYIKEAEEQIKEGQIESILIYTKDLLKELGYAKQTKNAKLHLSKLIDVLRNGQFAIDVSNIKDNPNFQKFIKELNDNNVFIDEGIILQSEWKDFMLYCSPIQTDENGEDYIKVFKKPITSVFAEAINQISVRPKSLYKLSSLRNLPEHRIMYNFLLDRISAMQADTKRRNHYFKENDGKIRYEAIWNQNGLPEYDARVKRRLRNENINSWLSELKDRFVIYDFEEYPTGKAKNSKKEGLIIYIDHIAYLVNKKKLNEKQLADVKKLIGRKDFEKKITTLITSLSMEEAKSIKTFYDGHNELY